MYKLGKSRDTSFIYRSYAKRITGDDKIRKIVNRIRKNRKAAKAARIARRVNR